MTPASLLRVSPGRTGIQVADRLPPLRPLPPEEDGDPSPARLPARRTKLPPGLYRPTTACRRCAACLAGQTCRSKIVMKMIWCRPSIDGVR